MMMMCGKDNAYQGQDGLMILISGFVGTFLIGVTIVHVLGVTLIGKLSRKGGATVIDGNHAHIFENLFVLDTTKNK